MTCSVAGNSVRNFTFTNGHSERNTTGAPLLKICSTMASVTTTTNIVPVRRNQRISASRIWVRVFSPANGFAATAPELVGSALMP